MRNRRSLHLDGFYPQMRPSVIEVELPVTSLRQIPARSRLERGSVDATRRTMQGDRVQGWMQYYEYFHQLNADMQVGP